MNVADMRWVFAACECQGAPVLIGARSMPSLYVVLNLTGGDEEQSLDSAVRWTPPVGTGYVVERPRCGNEVQLLAQQKFAVAGRPAAFYTNRAVVDEKITKKVRSPPMFTHAEKQVGLRSAVEHRGVSPASGHYVAWKRNEGLWHEYDDRSHRIAHQFPAQLEREGTIFVCEASGTGPPSSGSGAQPPGITVSRACVEARSGMAAKVPVPAEIAAPAALDMARTADEVCGIAVDLRGAPSADVAHGIDGGAGEEGAEIHSGHGTSPCV